MTRKTYSQDIEGDLLLPPARSPTTTARRLTSASGLEHDIRWRHEKESRKRTARLATTGDDTHDNNRWWRGRAERDCRRKAEECCTRWRTGTRMQTTTAATPGACLALLWRIPYGDIRRLRICESRVSRFGWSRDRRWTTATASAWPPSLSPTASCLYTQSSATSCTRR